MSKKGRTSQVSASVTKEDKWVRITFDAPASLRKAVKLKAAQEERSIKEVLCELMENYVNDNDGKVTKNMFNFKKTNEHSKLPKTDE